MLLLWGVIFCAMMAKKPLAPTEKYKVQALFIHTFTNYITWETNNRADFVIAAYKDSEILPYLNQLKTSKKVAGKSIEIKIIDPAGADGIPDCDIFYFDAKHQKQANAHLAKKSLNGILVVSQVSSAPTAYANINLKEVNDSYKFEVYKGNIEKNKMKVSSNLLKLAIKIYE